MLTKGPDRLNQVVGTRQLSGLGRSQKGDGQMAFPMAEQGARGHPA